MKRKYLAIETKRSRSKETEELRNICSSKWGGWSISGTRPLSKEVKSPFVSFWCGAECSSLSGFDAQDTKC